jgi:hypothetical protein
LNGDEALLERKLAVAGASFLAAALAAWLTAAMSPYHWGGREGGGAAFVVLASITLVWFLATVLLVLRRRAGARRHLWILLAANGAWAVPTFCRLTLNCWGEPWSFAADLGVF